MFETNHLQPPLYGPQSDPLLFGVAAALACLFPVEDVRPQTRSGQPDPAEDEHVEEPLAA